MHSITLPQIHTWRKLTTRNIPLELLSQKLMKSNPSFHVDCGGYLCTVTQWFEKQSACRQPHKVPQMCTPPQKKEKNAQRQLTQIMTSQCDKKSHLKWKCHLSLTWETPTCCVIREVVLAFSSDHDQMAYKERLKQKKHIYTSPATKFQNTIHSPNIQQDQK